MFTIYSQVLGKYKVPLKVVKDLNVFVGSSKINTKDYEH